MSQEQKVRFRGAVGGYNKDDVNAYISRISDNFRSVEQSLKNAINQQKKELQEQQEYIQAQRQTLQQQSALLAQSETDRQKCADQQQALCDMQRTVQEQKDTLAKKECAQAELEQSLGAKDDLIRQLQQQIVQSDARFEQLAAAMELLRRKCDTVAASIPAVAASPAPAAVPAQTAARAEPILPAEEYTVPDRSFNRTAESMPHTAAPASQAAASDGGDAVQRVAQMGQIASACRNDLQEELEDIRSSLDQMLLEIRSKYTQMNHRIDDAKSELDDI